MSLEKLLQAVPKARAARSNPDCRYDANTRDAFDDGWGPDDDLPTLRTDVRVERPRKVITRNTSPDLSFDRSINPYRGCEHGCIYCFARPTHAYLGLSPGLDFETRLIARPDAADILRRELDHPKYVPDVIAIGTNTDPYQPIEKEHRIMRSILEVLSEYRHPVAVVTKGSLIERDADLLGEMGQAGLARVGISITTLDQDIARKMEPRAPAPQRRLQTIRKLVAAGCPVRIMASPMIPGLTDHELEAILKAGAEAGVIAASWITLRLPLEVSSLFQEWLHENFPDRAKRIMGQIRDLHGGQDYAADWGARFRGRGAYAKMMRQRFDLATKRLCLDRRIAPLRTDLFQRPPRAGDQLSLF